MGVIFKPKYMIGKMQQCVCIHIQIMHYHIGNVLCDVVTDLKTLIILTNKQMMNIPTLFLQFDFKFII